MLIYDIVLRDLVTEFNYSCVPILYFISILDPIIHFWIVQIWIIHFWIVQIWIVHFWTTRTRFGIKGFLP